MSVELKPLSFRRFAKNASEIYGLFKYNYMNLVLLLWRADKSMTPDTMRFYLFWASYIMGTKCRKMLYKINFVESYDEQFLVYRDGEIAGMCGLDDIDVKKKSNARVWGFGLRINPFGTADSAIKQIEEHARELGLNSIYTDVGLDDKRDMSLCYRNNFEIKKVSEDRTSIFPHHKKITYTLTYEKDLGR